MQIPTVVPVRAVVQSPSAPVRVKADVLPGNRFDFVIILQPFVRTTFRKWRTSSPCCCACAGTRWPTYNVRLYWSFNFPNAVLFVTHFSLTFVLTVRKYRRCFAEIAIKRYIKIEKSTKLKKHFQFDLKCHEVCRSNSKSFS